jgi:hypothetical protein
MRWIFFGLLAALAIGMIYTGSDPELSRRYSEAIRGAELSTSSKDLVMGGIALAIIGFVGWFFFVRKS